MEIDRHTSRDSLQSLRAVVPYVLTAIVAGLGHLYLRYWRRGLAWFGLFAITLVFLSTYTMEAPQLFVMSVLGAELSPLDVAFPGAILLLCLIDLYLLDRFDS